MTTRLARAAQCGFTLLELMVVVAIMGIVMTISIPAIYQQLHPESMRKAVSDVMEACSHARARAILNGAETDLVIRPGDRQFTVSGAISSPAPGQNQMFSPDVAGNDWRPRIPDFLAHATAAAQLPAGPDDLSAPLPETDLFRRRHGHARPVEMHQGNATQTLAAAGGG
jgi:prepilin-type N-terminal cleavage/methylation domain-containing protein